MKDALLVFTYLESNPIIEIQKIAEALGIAYNTTSGAVNRLVDAGILVQTTNANRNPTFAYESVRQTQNGQGPLHTLKLRERNIMHRQPLRF